MAIFEFIFEIADIFWSWRIYVWLIPALLVAYFLHDNFPEARWLWFLTVPGVLTAFIMGLRWECRSSWRSGL